MAQRGLLCAAAADEHTRECLLMRAERRWSSAKVIGALSDVMVWKGVPSIYVPITDRSSRPKIYASGWPMLEPEHCISNPAPLGRTGTANRLTRSLEMSSLMGRSSTPSGSCACWPSDRTLRWAIDHPLRKHGWPQPPRGMEKWKPLRASHFPTPPTAAIDQHR